jgi:uncharacterized zinc-type alcohol dehydrogenase-like protein
MPAMGRRRLASGGPAGSAYTHAMLAFCAEHNIVADVAVIALDQINDAFADVNRATSTTAS